MMLAANMFVGPEIDWFKISPFLVMLGGVLLLILAGSLTAHANTHTPLLSAPRLCTVDGILFVE